MDVLRHMLEEPLIRHAAALPKLVLAGSTSAENSSYLGINVVLLDICMGKEGLSERRLVGENENDQTCERKSKSKGPQDEKSKVKDRKSKSKRPQVEQVRAQTENKQSTFVHNDSRNGKHKSETTNMRAQTENKHSTFVQNDSRNGKQPFDKRHDQTRSDTTSSPSY